MEIIYCLGEKLADELKISPPAARGLIKLSIKDQLGPYVEFNRINYNDFCNVLNNSLKERLIILNISNYESIANKLLVELELNQSLITMEGVKL